MLLSQIKPSQPWHRPGALFCNESSSSVLQSSSYQSHISDQRFRRPPLPASALPLQSPVLHSAVTAVSLRAPQPLDSPPASPSFGNASIAGRLRATCIFLPVPGRGLLHVRRNGPVPIFFSLRYLQLSGNCDPALPSPVAVLSEPTTASSHIVASTSSTGAIILY